MDMQTIGKKIKDLRKARHLSQDDFGRVLGVSRATVGSWESGRRNISVNHLAQVCRYFKVDPTIFKEENSVDEIIDLLERARSIFNNADLSREEKQGLHDELVKLYLQMKG